MYIPTWLIIIAAIVIFFIWKSKKKGVSQDKLSKLARVTYNTVIKIESGATPNPTIETMAKIAKGLGVSIDDLMI